jgi:hypothetical protein
MPCHTPEESVRAWAGLETKNHIRGRNPFGKVVFGKVVPFGIWYLVFGKRKNNPIKSK